MMTKRILSLLIASLLLSACIPTIQRQWDVQPVEGIIRNGDTGQPVSGATITNRDNPNLTAVSDGNGRFEIEEQTHVGFHLLMAASALDRQIWVVSHPEYAAAIIETRSLIPPLSRSLSEPDIALYRDLGASPETCPWFGYLKRQAQRQRLRTDAPDFLIEECQDDDAREALYKLWYADNTP